MTFEIIGNANIDDLYCAGSFTKLLTAFVCLNKLAENFNLDSILDDENFFDSLCNSQETREFLSLFQNKLGGKFSIRDICSFYAGLPYTFDLSPQELKRVEAGYPFKHHSIPTEDYFLQMCRDSITPVFKPRCKFHYSEISILFLGYFIEKCYAIDINDLYQKYLIKAFNLQKSLFSRKRPANVITKDLSFCYDYPSVGILDHGYFCYSNGFYTTLRDMKSLLEGLIQHPIFSYMVDIKKARAASNRLLNGLTIEMRLVGDDFIYGYEGYSFSGCNIWNYSTKNKKGYIGFTDDEEYAYKLVYDDYGYTKFDTVPHASEVLYENFKNHYDFNQIHPASIPIEFRGKYQRVNINDSKLEMHFELGQDYMVIRNPDIIKYDIVFVADIYRIRSKDNLPGQKIGLYVAPSGHYYFMFDGTLYKKI